jgi:small conductance mechanosensitive channel
MDIGNLIETSKPVAIALVVKVLGALAIYIVGRMLIGMVTTLITKALERQKIEPTVIRYVASAISVLLNVMLVVGILGYFGVETTSFAALLAALGIAIGAAWGGLLSNFAAGAFILVLRPFKVDDYVVAGEVEGTVRAIGLFTTSIDAPDNVMTMVGNAKFGRRAAQNRQRRARSETLRRDPDIQRAGSGARRATVRQHAALLAGVLRHQQGDPRHVRRRGIPGGGSASARAATTGRLSQRPAIQRSTERRPGPYTAITSISAPHK